MASSIQFLSSSSCHGKLIKLMEKENASFKYPSEDFLLFLSECFIVVCKEVQNGLQSCNFYRPIHTFIL